MHTTEGQVDLILKQLERPDSEGGFEAFTNEVSILSALRCLQHPNIITLVTTFSKGDTQNFLFQRADGDLKALLSSSHFALGLRTETDFLGSLWGLSSALEAVHHYFYPKYNVRQIGCHFDVKPDNILLKDGKLILSDFGLSRLRQVESGSQTTFQAGAPSYMAPECESPEEDFRHQRIGRASDIWSFGCVIAEILVYLKAEPGSGPTAIQKFSSERKLKVMHNIFYPFYDLHGVHEAVRRLLKSSMTDQSISHGLRSLAKIIQAILQYEPTHRPPAAEITRLLFHLTQKTRIMALVAVFGSSAHPLNLEFEIEIERLRIWSNSAGLNNELLDVPKSAWFGVSHSIEEYESLQHLLIEIEKEIHMIAAEVQKTTSKRPAFRLYYRLQLLQDQLWDSQSSIVRRHMFDQLEETILGKKYRTEYQEPLDSIDSPDGDSNLLSNQWFRKRFAYLATMKNVASALTRQDHQMHNNHLERRSIKGPWSELGAHTVGIFEPTAERVFIEFLNYGEAWTSREKELLERVNAIASLRSKGVLESIFPILQCRGYYHEPARTRFGIVYQLPEKAQNTIPMSLARMFTETQSMNQQPSLTQRFKLASSLVSHVLSFHRGGWLHRSISALNIICFPHAFPSIAASLAKAYFIGFNHSRVNDDDEYSSPSGPEIEYQHPLYQRNTQAYSDDMRSRNRFCQEFDYYSVGLVLIEIALWRPLSSMTRGVEGSPVEMLEQLQKKYVPLVKISMGDIYYDAVRYCLTVSDESQNSLVEVREIFNEKVVLPISQCVI